jgi:phage terminase small subunit
VALTAKQQRFVEQYLIDLNATQAAIRAGYSPRTAAQIGAENLRKPDISAAVQAGRDEQQRHAELRADWVLLRLREEAERTGTGAGHSARVRALELLGKHLGMFTDRVSVETPVRLRITEVIVSTEEGDSR